MNDDESFMWYIGILIISITIGNMFVAQYGFLMLGGGFIGWAIINLLIRKFWK